MFQLIRDALKLDVANLSFLYGSELGVATSIASSKERRRGIHLRIGSYFWNMLLSFWLLWPNGYRFWICSCKVLFFGTSANQLRALSSTSVEVDGSCLVDRVGRVETSLPVFFAYLFSLFFFPLILYKYIASNGISRTQFSFVIDEYWLAYGIYLLVRIIIRHKEIKGIIVANDHMFWTRTIIQAARDEQIITIYIQHASVTDKFPPLAFDYSLLEGIDAFEKYEAAGKTKTKVFLIGIPRCDSFVSRINRRSSVRAVGICLSPEMVSLSLEPLCKFLISELPELILSIRPHPSTKNMVSWIQFSRKHHLEFSDPRIQEPFEFLDKVDAIIAGESNIILEAVLMNVYPLYYDFDGKKLDWYGFSKNGLVEYSSTPNNLVKKLNELMLEKPHVRDKASRYCETVGTKFDGFSSDLASNLINEIFSEQGIDYQNWRRDEINSRIELYRP